MSKKNLVILGAGGHAKVCYDIAQLMGEWEEIVILADNPENDYFEIAGPIKDAESYISNSEFFVAIGDNHVREKITHQLINLNCQLVSLIHPNAVIAKGVEIEVGTVISAGVVINSATKIGKGCIINTSTSIDHDNSIGDFVHLSPGVNLAGGVVIYNNSWIGIGSVVIQNTSVGENAIIGAGSTILDNVEPNIIVVGSPAKKINSK